MARKTEPTSGQSMPMYEHAGSFVLGMGVGAETAYPVAGALLYNPESNQYIAPLEIGISLIFDDRQKLVGWYRPNNEE